MKTVVIYDSTYGNTRAIAEAIAASLSGTATPMESANAATLAGADLVVVGSPTQGGRPTPATKAFIEALPADILSGKVVAAFDTRLAIRDQPLPLRFLMRLIGYAAPRIAKVLEARGGTMRGAPEGFVVVGKEGPLKVGELERSIGWAQTIQHTPVSHEDLRRLGAKQ
jgi:hypothetical protein